jgi:hypothetical protein
VCNSDIFSTSSPNFRWWGGNCSDVRVVVLDVFCFGVFGLVKGELQSLHMSNFARSTHVGRWDCDEPGHRYLSVGILGNTICLNDQRRIFVTPK